MTAIDFAFEAAQIEIRENFMNCAADEHGFRLDINRGRDSLDWIPTAEERLRIEEISEDEAAIPFRPVSIISRNE